MSLKSVLLFESRGAKENLNSRCVVRFYVLVVINEAVYWVFILSLFSLSLS
jgi:hypothetical protein